MWFLIRSFIDDKRKRKRIEFLQTALKRASDPIKRKSIELRICALEGMWYKDYLHYYNDLDRELSSKWYEIIYYELQ